MALRVKVRSGLKTLADGISRGVVKRAIRRGYVFDTSGAAVLRRLRDLGYRIRSQVFYDLRREVIASTPQRFNTFFRDLERRPSLNQHIFTEDNFPTAYKYVVRVKARSATTDSAYSFPTGIYSDEILSGEEIEKIIRNRFTEVYFNREDYQGSDRALQWHGVFDSVESFQAFQHFQ